VSRARFESKLMQASTAYRMTVYRHQTFLLDRTSSQLLAGKTESAVKRLSCKYLEVQRLCVQRSVPTRRRVEPTLNWAAEP